ncbi:MAG: phosphotransferase [Candidatus Pacebacteria bacterium]|nr:phosphotransferase [Candidatus Paceibacterota bacterium]
MVKLKPENQIVINNEIMDTICKSYGILHFDFETINQGIENSSFRIFLADKKYVLRVYAQGKNDSDILLEINFQDYLRHHNIPIPIIHPNTKGEKLNIVEISGKRWQTILMDLVEGQSRTTKPSKELIVNLATLQAKMHLLGIEFSKITDGPKKSWVALRDTLASKIDRSEIGGQEVQNLIERIKKYNYFLSSDLPHGYNHLDIDLDGNVITNNDKIAGIIDFDDLKYSPLIVCLGYSIWNILDDEGIASAKIYLKAYVDIRPITPLEYLTLSNVVLFRNYVIAIIRLLHWNSNTSIDRITSLINLEKEIPVLLSPQNLKNDA